MRVGLVVKLSNGDRLVLRPDPKYGEHPDPEDGLYEYSNVDRSDTFKPTFHAYQVSGAAAFPASARRRLKRWCKRESPEHVLLGVRFDLETTDGRRRYFLVYWITSGSMWDYAYEARTDAHGRLHREPLWVNATWRPLHGSTGSNTK